jgi:hypothetical protein
MRYTHFLHQASSRPYLPDARAAAHSDRPRMTYFTVDQAASEIRGYSLLPSGKFGAPSYATVGVKH